MIRIVQTEAPWSFGYYPRQAAALHGWVKNAKPTQTVRDNVQYMAVDAKARAEKIRRVGIRPFSGRRSSFFWRRDFWFGR